MPYNNIIDKIEREKNDILNRFLKSAPFDGWNESNLKKSSIACGFQQDYHLLLFSGGIAEFTQYFYSLLDDEMTKEFLNHNPYQKISDKIIYLIELKLALYSNNKEAIRCLTQYSILPQNLLTTQKQLWQTCDQIWHLAGDESTDYNYYTKRALLAAIYSSTLLYWLGDDSKEYQDSKEFLKSKIRNIGIINRYKSSISNFFKELLT